MKRSRNVLVSLLIAACVLTAPAAGRLMAQDRAKEAVAVQKVLFEDDKVRVTETTFKPGEVGTNALRGYRVTYVIKGGMHQRTYSDGRIEKNEWTTGEVRAQGPDKLEYFTKNVGSTEIVLYTVTVKGVK